VVNFPNSGRGIEIGLADSPIRGVAGLEYAIWLREIVRIAEITAAVLAAILSGMEKEAKPISLYPMDI
jgi:hypothetical protein